MKNFSLLIIVITLYLSCSKPNNEQEKALVKIGDRVISVNEFLARCELTPRPFYCRSNTERAKTIALNSLIVEKLFALEEGKNSELLSRPQFRAYLKGKKEQYMREGLFNRITKNTAEIAPSEIEERLPLTSMVYNVEYYTLDRTAAQEVEKKLKENPDAASLIFDALNFTDIPPHKIVRYKDPDDPVIHHALFSRPLKPDEVIGPLTLQNTQSIILKIKQVLYDPLLSESEALDRKRFIRKRLVEKKANTLWNKFVAEIMKGKDIQFVPQTTIKLAELYSKKDQTHERKDNIDVCELEEKRTYLSLKDLSDNNFLMDAPFFRINDRVWTVNEFKELLRSHPLVFRKPDMAPDEYLHQFKLAVIDLIRDYYVTQEAYKRSIDKLENVKRNVEMWQDAYLARYHREKYLKSLAQRSNFGRNRMKGTCTYIDEYADSLQEKYSPIIEINYNEFAKIKLTKTDMFSVRQFVPYPLVVPAFPELCIDDELDYGTFVHNSRKTYDEDKFSCN